MLIDVLQSLADGEGVNGIQVLAQVMSVVFIMLCILPLHEFAHGWVAYKLGDPTAKNAGRLTFNPIRSLDPGGAISMLLFGFGWAKPVPVDPRYFKNPKRGMAVTALAGPLSNLLAALIGAFLTVGMSYFVVNNVTLFIFQALYYYAMVNVSLAVFNLLPIPPLDGSRIVGMFLSDKALASYYQRQQMWTLLLMILLFSGKLSGPLATVQQAVTGMIFRIASSALRFLGAW